jgi:integrase
VISRGSKGKPERLQSLRRNRRRRCRAIKRRQPVARQGEHLTKQREEREPASPLSKGSGQRQTGTKIVSRSALGLLDAVEGSTATSHPPRTPGIGAAFNEFLCKHVRRKDGRPIRDSTKRQTAALLGFRCDPAKPGAWIRTGNGVLARWQGRTVQSIRQSDVIDLLDEIASRTPVKANRCLSALKSFFAWRMRRDETLARSPCANVAAPCAENSRDRVLSDAALAALWRAAKVEGRPFGPVVQVLILSGLRRDEVRCAVWSEIDLEGRRWTIPGVRTKNGRDHLVPLSDQMAAILQSLPRGSSLLFSNYRPHANFWIEPNEAASRCGHDARTRGGAGALDAA